MTPDEFKRAWEAQSAWPLIVFPPSVFEGTGVSQQTRQFLTEAGLPEVVGPFLMIHSPGPRTLATAGEEWELSPELDDYWVIGNNGAGDPIVLCADDAVVYLGHDSDFEECFINRNVVVLAEASLRFPGMEPADAEKEAFIDFLRRADPDALADGSFWSYEIAAWSDPD